MWLGGGKRFFKCREGRRCIRCINYSKSRGARAHLGGGERPPLNIAQHNYNNYNITSIIYVLADFDGIVK